MRPYELVVLLHPDLEIDADAPIKKLEKLIEGLGGKIIKRDNWGKKRLAYPVKKQDFAVYVFFKLSIEPENVRKLEDSLLITEEVLRHLLVTEVPEVAPQPARKSPAEVAETKATAAAEAK